MNVSQDVKQKAFLVSLSQLILGVIGPLVIFFTAKDAEGDDFLKENAKNAINFNIQMMIAGFIASLTTIILIGFILLPLIGIAYFVLVIMASLKVKDGEVYEYPFTFKFLK